MLKELRPATLHGQNGVCALYRVLAVLNQDSETAMMGICVVWEE